MLPNSRIMVEPEPEIRLPYDNIMSLLLDPEYREVDPDMSRDASRRIQENRFGLQQRVMQLKKCHEDGNARRFDLMQEVQRDLAFWHYIRGYMDRENIPDEADDIWVMHEDGVADLVMDIASEKSIYVLDGGVQEVRFSHPILLICRKFIA